jgi:hypothetical protein
MELYVLLEGDDDRRFFLAELLTRLGRPYDDVTIWRYAEQTAPIRRRVIDGIRASGDEYIFFADLNDAPCVTARKEALQRSIPNIDQDRIVVVSRAIEAWYLAGLPPAAQRQMRVDVGRIPNLTDSCGKDELDSVIPQRHYRGRTDFMKEVLKRYSLSEARRRNRSLEYFLRKYC